MSQEVKQWKTDSLIEYARNPRKNDHAVDRIASAIKEFGFRVPILVKSDKTVIDGHLRLKAAKKLEMDTVPVLLVDDMTETQIKAFRISINRMAELAEWDHDLLSLELEELRDLDFDLDLTGFDPDDLETLIATEIPPGLIDEDEAPAPKENPVTNPGDIWILGDHRLMCGDSTSIEAIERLCDGQKVDMWLTYPPYNVAYQGKTEDALTIENDDMEDEEFREFLRDSYVAADSVMKPGAVFYIWHADSEGYAFRGAARDTGWIVRQCLIWVKSSIVLGRQDYHWKHEPCLYGWKSGAAHTWTSDRKQSTVLEFDRPHRNGEHPTMKPVSLFEYQMLNNSKRGGIILDSFGGSGTTMIAAEKNGRKSCLMELDPRYCDVIIKRWQDYTGKQAVLEESGRAFKDVA